MSLNTASRSQSWRVAANDHARRLPARSTMRATPPFVRMNHNVYGRQVSLSEKPDPVLNFERGEIKKDETLTALPTIPPLALPTFSLTALPTFSSAGYSYYVAGSTISKARLPAPGTIADQEVIYPKSWRFVAIITAICLAVFCMALDNTIISTAIPSITDEFHAIDDIAWYITAYFLMTCSFQLFFGRLYTFFNLKIVFLVAMAFFEVGSLICGVAPNSTSLIVGRAIAGLGSAGIFSGSILIVAACVELHKRPLYVGLAAAMYGIASVVGPLLGGIFTDQLSWRWCFYINLPIGAITIGFIVFAFQDPPNGEYAKLALKEKLMKLDFIGLVNFVLAMVCLILALQWGGLWYAWSDWRIILMLASFGVLMILFVILQAWQKENATVPLRIVRQRSIGGAAWWAFTFGGSFLIFVYYIPIWFQGIQGVSATRSGINSLPLVLSSSALCGLSGVIITVWGYYTPLLIASTVIMTVGSGLLSTFHRTIPVDRWVGYQLVAGSGFGLGIQIPLITVQAVLDVQDIPTGTAVIMFCQTLGGALFLAVAQNIFLTKLGARIAAIVPGVDVKALFKSGGATNIRSFLVGDLLIRVLDAYADSLSHSFYVGTALAAISIFGAVVVEWKSVKGQFLIGAG